MLRPPPQPGARMTAPLELRPVASSFVFARISAAVLVLGVFGGIATAIVAAFVQALATVPALFFGGLLAFAVIEAFAAVRKERYELGSSTIVVRSGGLFSDREAVLELRNVTHVKQRLPWIRYRFFNVGDVVVESAGSSSAEVVLRSMADPDAVYGLIADRLRGNGFSLRRGSLLHEEQPDRVGVVVEILGLLAGIVGVGVWIAVSLVFEFAGGGDDVRRIVAGSKAGIAPGVVTAALFVVPALIAIFGSVFAVLRYLDMRRRTYRVFDDVVVYEEGFLDRTNAFVPYENIADADLAKNLLDQILGLSDVKVSCQGSAQEIRFRRLRRGDELKAAIGQLVVAANDAKRRLQASAPASSPAFAVGGDGPQASAARPRVGAAPPVALDPALAWTATLRPVPLRAVAAFVWMLPAFPLWLAATLAEWIRTSAAVYSVRPTSVGARTGILAVHEREFSYDKVTGVVLRSSPLDRVFGTMAVEIWSIGSTAPLVFAHVRRDEVDVPRLLRNLGIEDAPPAHELATHFGPGVWIRAALPGFVMLGLLLAAMVIVPVAVDEPILAGTVLPLLALVVGSYVWRQAWVAKQRLTLHATHVELQSGIWWRAHFHARYDDLKKVAVTRYPGGMAGSLRLFVAGERIIQQNNNQKGAPMPYSIPVSYVADTEGLGARLDEVISRARDAGDTARPAPAQVLVEARPAVANTMVGALVLSALLLPLCVVILPLAYARVRRRRYRLEAERVVRAEGLMYRTESSVLYERIDSLRQDQGLLGKMLGNGQVTVFTAGSSRPDLVLDALPDHASVYAALRARYQARGGQSAPVQPG
jgi:uncharacterized membrane protein YdbT with pleckstrin-like domain